MNFSRVGGAGTMSSEKLRLIAISRQTLSIISLLCRSVKTRAVDMASSQRGNPGSIIQWYALGKNVKTVMERRNLAYSWSQNTHLEDALLWFCFTLSSIDHYSGLSAYDSEGLWTSGLERKEGNARFHICREKGRLWHCCHAGAGQGELRGGCQDCLHRGEWIYQASTYLAGNGSDISHICNMSLCLT